VRRSRIALLVLPLLLGSCAAERILRVTSDPPGATVRIDDQVVGETPLDFSYEHYGIRRLTLRREGYLTQSERVELDPVWYARFPFDIFSEILFPFGWKDRRLVHLTLIPGEDLEGAPSLLSVIERASVLRHAGPEGPRNLPDAEPMHPQAIETIDVKTEPQ